MSSDTPAKSEPSFGSNMIADTISGLVVFLVALPLCLGIALASSPSVESGSSMAVPLFSGLIAGIVGGLVVGVISGSHTSVSGPAAGLTAIVATQIETLGSFQAFLVAIAISGVLQIIMGLLKAGTLSAFFPSSVIKGLLAAIGVILILKQIPHLFGHDKDAEGEMSYVQPDGETTFSELTQIFGHAPELGAICVGLVGVAILVVWGRTNALKNSLIPAPLVVVLAGVAMKLLFDRFGPQWAITGNHLVDVPVAGSASELIGFMQFPDFAALANPQVYVAAVTIAIVASLETLLNLQAVDKLDKQKRTSPPSRELIAQGCGNIAAGLLGGLPVTSVIIRGSVNVNSGSRTKMSAVIHGGFLAVSVLLLPTWLSLIPLSALAAILIVTGFKLASPALFAQMRKEGRYQFIPFIVTLVAIVRTDLLTGILIGLGVSILFILNSNLRSPVRRNVVTRLMGSVQHIELGSQVTFLNKAAITEMLNGAEKDTQLLIDGSDVDFIDPDISSLIREFKENVAPKRGVKVSLRGFSNRFGLPDSEEQPEDAASQDHADASPLDILTMLREGNRRFQSGQPLNRDHRRKIFATAEQESPVALVVSCIDSRVPPEIVLDSGLGDIISIRTPANILDEPSLAGIEYAVSVTGVKLIVVLGHRNCGVLSSCLNATANDASATSHTKHLSSVVESVRDLIGNDTVPSTDNEIARSQFMNDLAFANVARTIEAMKESCDVVTTAMEDGKLDVVGMVYDVGSGEVEQIRSA